MNHHELDRRMGILVKSERKITNKGLQTICLAECQQTPLALGYKDTRDWLIRGHGYSEPAANRRVQAAQLLNDVPEISEKIEQGKVNLTTLSQTQRTLKAQQKATGQKVSIEEKKVALDKIEGKRSREVEKELEALFPDAVVHEERCINKRDGGKILVIELSEDDANEFKRAREVLSHAMPDASLGQILGRLAKEFHQRKDPLRKPTSSRRPTSQRKAVTVKHGSMTSLTRRELIRRAGGKCSFVNQRTGVKCESRWQLEVDHVIPKAKGGTDEPSNLRCLCRKHNQFVADAEFGREFMQKRRQSH
jgi:5-methylcytosine-specific restriction endonuclease McrA